MEENTCHQAEEVRVPEAPAAEAVRGVAAEAARQEDAAVHRIVVHMVHMAHTVVSIAVLQV